MIWVIGFAAILLIAAIASYRNAGAAIGVLITTYGIETFLQSQSSYIVDHGSYTNIAVGVIVLIAAFFSLMRSSIKLSDFSNVQVLIIIIYAFGFVSFVWTLSPDQFHRWKSELPHILTYTVLAPVLTREKGALSSGFRWVLWIGIPIMILTAFYCQWGIRGIILAKPIRIGERLSHESLPLAIASLASIIGVIALVIDLKKMPFKFAFRISVLGLALMIAFMTQSRGQVVAIIAVSAIIYPISNRAKNAKGLFLTVLGFVVFSGVFVLLIRNLTLQRWQGDHVESAITGRQELWLSLLSYWFEHPGMNWLVGLGACSSFDIVGFYPHNLPVEILAELGLIGIVVFSSIMIKSFYNGLVLLSKLSVDSRIRGDSVAIIGIIGVNFALCLKEGSLYTWSPLFFFTICLAQQVRLARKAKNSLGLRRLFIVPNNYDQHPNQFHPGQQFGHPRSS